MSVLHCSDDTSIRQFDPKVELDPPAIDFGDVELGTTAELNLRIKNPGEGTLSIKSLAPKGDLDEAFTYDLESKSVPAGGLTLARLTFNPTRLGAHRGTLELVPDTTKLGPVDIEVKGNGVVPTLKVEPAELLFGNVVVETTKTLDVVVTNTSSIRGVVEYSPISNVRLCASQIRGSDTFCVAPKTRPFAADNTFELAAGESVTLSVSFTPDRATGATDQGIFRLKSCDQAACEVDVRLKGTGIEQGFVCDPSELDFGQVNPNSCVTRTVTCENIANERVTIINWKKANIGGNVSSATFEVEAFGRPVDLLEGDSVEVDVTFCPKDLGSHTGHLEIETDNSDPRRRFALVPLKGTGGGPDIDVVPLEINFGQVSLIAPARRSISITNLGYAPLSVTNILVDAMNTGAFRSQSQAAGVVDVGGFMPFVVEFQPQVEGPIETRLIVQSNDQDEPEVEVILRGEGVNLPPCSFEVVPSTLNFGVVERGRSLSRAFEVRNTGAGRCLLTSVRVAADPSGSFSLPDGEINSVFIDEGTAATVRVLFSPQFAGTHQAEIEFSISSPTSPYNTVRVAGNGADSAILIVPNDIDFGTIKKDCRARSRTVQIYNTGVAAARIDSIRFADPANPAFSLLNLPAPLPGAALNLAAGESTVFEVSFEPTAYSSYAGAVEISGTFGGQAATYIVSLTGRGAEDARQIDEFEQLGKPKVDILFVVDDSCSMSEEQEALTQNFDTFIQFAQAQQLDYQIGVTTTDVGDGDPAELGRLIPLTGTPADRIVTPDSQPSPEAAFSQNANVGIDNSTFSEAGLEAAYLALSNPLIFGHNSGFLRPDAVLSIIVVSDEEDQSAESVDFYVNFFQSIKGFRATNLFTLSAIAGDAPSGCSGSGGSAQAGLRYLAAADRTGGVFQSICTPDWSRSLEDLSTAAFGFKSRFFLTNQPQINPFTIKVIVNDVELPPREAGGTINWTYDFTSNTINFSPFATPEPGAQIRVEYVVDCLD